MKEPIRILHIFSSLDVGGVENFVMNVYRNLNHREVQFDFAMTSGKKAFYDDEVLSYGGRVFYLDHERNTVHSISNLLRNERFDGIHSHVFFYSGIILLIARINNIPIRISHAHNAYTGERMTIFRALYIKLMRLSIYCNSTSMLGCSVKACKYLYGDNCFTNHKTKIIPDGIDCTRFKFDENIRKQYRELYGVSGKYVVGHVGHFLPAKNHEKIIHVFSEIKKINNNAILFLVGNGRLEQDVYSLVNQMGLANDVIFAGAHTDVENFYQIMDVFLFPSKYEGFGMAMIEAEANGLFCVASDEIPKEADPAKRAAFLSLGAPDTEWAQTAINVPGRDRTNKCYQMVKERFNIEEVSRLLIDIYCEDRVGENG